MEESPWDINSKSSYLNIDGPIVDYIGPNDYKVVTLVRAKDRISSQNGIFYFEVKIINVGNNGIIGIGFCAKPNMTIYDSNMLMPGQSSNSCSYHSDDGYSFCFGKSRPYGPIYTSGDTIGCYLNFRKNEVFFTKNGINLGVIEFHLHGSKYDLYPCVGLRSQGGSITINFRNSGDFEYSVMNNDDVDGILWGKNCLEFLIDNELDQFLENYPNNAFALMYRGISYLMMNMYEEALEDFAKVLEILPDDSLALSYRGKTNFIKGKHEPALEDFSKALENEPNNVHALKFRGKYYFIRGEYDKAFEDLTKLLEIEPNNAIALRYRAEIYMLDEKYYESSADLKELLKINPDNKWTQEANNFVDEM